MKNLLLLLLLAPFSIWGQEVYQAHQAVVMDFDGPNTYEKASENPFLAYRLQVRFSLDGQEFNVPGFYAADGNAAETGAEAGNVWRVIFTPPQAGTWQYAVSFRRGYRLALEDDPYLGDPIRPHDGKRGVITVREADEAAEGFAKSGRLQYQGNAYLHTADGKALLKFGANSPENFLAYADIDGTYAYDPEKSFIKTWEPHIKDWQEGDPLWMKDKGKGIIGALNYLAAQGMNVVYALTLNIEGDARDVWPFISHKKGDRTRYDVSKLAQWDIIFSHAEALGIIMHLITQEKENELILDDGNTAFERKLYYRELVARFAHHNNIIWNMGEENGQAPFWRQGQNDQQRFAMIRYLKDHDPYRNPLVIHTMSEAHERDRIISPLLGFDRLDGLSLQVSWVHNIHQTVLDWNERSRKANRPWLMMMDEIGPWYAGTKPDDIDPEHDSLRQFVLWGTMMAGGGGVEWYFGWHRPPNDLNAEDWRSREKVWQQTRIARDIFQTLPYTEMVAEDALLADEAGYVFHQPGSVWLVYLFPGKSARLDLREASGTFQATWINPRTGERTAGQQVEGGGWRALGSPPAASERDWVILLKKAE
ncbi:MAG: DUF5060 domain-containing protein [Bacteroidota bacterium]